MVTAKGVTAVNGEIKIGFREYEGKDEKGRTITLKIFDDAKYTYVIDNKLIDSGEKLSEYSCVYDPQDGRDADEGICFECRPSYDEGDREPSPYIFVYSPMYDELGVDA
jgi:hypothetical protein